MYSIRHSTKKVLFDKGKKESLTPEEQAEYDEIVDWIRPAKVIVEPKEPVWEMALQVYNYIKKEHTTTWEQLEPLILQATGPVTRGNTVKHPVRLWGKWIKAVLKKVKRHLTF